MYAGNYYTRTGSGNIYTWYAVQTVAPSLTVRVEKSDSPDWNNALSQFGNPSINPTANVRVCVGSEIHDFIVSGALLVRPSGWSGNGIDVATKSFNMPPATMEPASWGYSIVQPSSNWNPPVAGYIPTDPLYGTAGAFNTALAAQRAAVAGSITQNTSSKAVVAYQIEQPSAQWSNPSGWQPNWQVVDGVIKSINTGPTGGLDRQETSIFSTRVTVSQSAYGAKAVGGYVGTDVVVLPRPVDPVGGNQNTTIVIRLEPQLWISVDGTPRPIIRPPIITPPILPPNPPPDPNINPDPSGKDKPPRDGGGTRPIRPGGPGGGTPVVEEYIALEVTPDPIEHDDTDIGTVRTKSFTVKNIGTIPIEITSIINTHPENPFTFGMVSPINIPFTISPDEVFAGTSYFIPGSASNYDELGYLRNGSTILKTFTLLGTGTASGNPGDPIVKKIALSSTLANSGDTNFLEQTINVGITKKIKAINVGNVPLTLNSATIGGSGVFTTPGITAGTVLQVGLFAEINVTFTPLSAIQYSGTFTVNSDAEESDQPGFNPATGDIVCSLAGKGTPIEQITRIMSFNVENNGTFEDALAGGSATTELDVTITNIGNSTLEITQFQVQQPFTLELDVFGTFTIGSFEFYSLNSPLYIEPTETSQAFKVKFTPPTATNFVDDVAIVSNKTIGPESFEVRGLGLFEYPEEPEEPEEPVTPDDEPPPGQEFDPGTVPSSDLDGNGSSCISKGCNVPYVYEYSSNGEIVT